MVEHEGPLRHRIERFRELEQLRVVEPDVVGEVTARHLAKTGAVPLVQQSSAAARPTALGAVAGIDDDLTAMMASRPMTDADITTAEDAAERH